MNLQRIFTVVDKEWAEVFKNKFVLFTVAFLPLLFAALPIGILASMGGSDLGGDVTDIPEAFLAVCGDAPPGECLQIFLLQQFMLLYLIMPLIIPVSIAAYSIVGEKTTRSLEPLLATPITTEELLAAKAIAAVVPAVLATWLGFGLFVLGAWLLGDGPAALRAIFSPTWLLAIFLLGPLMAVVAVSFAIMVSSRVNDPRAAEQTAAVVIVPLMVVFFGQIAGFIVLNVTLVLTAAVVLLLVDVAMVFLAARLFEREVILTRWK